MLGERTGRGRASGGVGAAQPAGRGKSGRIRHRFEHVPHGPKYIVYCVRLEPGLNNMTSESPPNSPLTRSFSLSIGQLTFGSFMLVLAVIIITSAASVIAIRHIDLTFAELQRLQSVGDLAEDIDRRMNELRLAARDFVTDPGTQSNKVGAAATTLLEILKKTRLELAPEQQNMIDGVTERLATYRTGIERISALINRRAEMIVALAPLREKFDMAVAGSPDPVIASTVSQAQSRIASALLAHDPSAAQQAAKTMRTLTISDSRLRMAVDAYADAIISISIRERQISAIDKEVLGSEGRLIQRVTELLREVSARRGHVLSRDFARTLTEAKWQSIVLGSAGVLIGLFAALLVVRRTVRPLARIAASIRAVAGGEKNTAIPATDVDNEIGDIARAAEVFRQTLVDADAAREAAVRALAEQRLAEESYRKLFEVVGRWNLRHDARWRAAQCQPGAGADDGLRHAAGFAQRHRRHRRFGLRRSPSTGGIPAADATRRHCPRI